MSGELVGLIGLAVLFVLLVIRVPVALASDGYFVTYLGYGNTAQVDFNEVRPYARPDTSDWRAGSECSAIAPTDGRWHDAKIVSVKDDACVVRFVGDAETSEVDLDACRLRKPSAATAAASSSAAAPAEAASSSKSAAAADSSPRMGSYNGPADFLMGVDRYTLVGKRIA
mgnify:CR=1 FL=1